ncbi:MAG TPA: SRPBCC family protein [Longimicrobiales bacterium]|nr:SRPBCC family protein [Longimicrobiales bacterium]
MHNLLRFWFTFTGPVGRGRYLRHGLGLMALKFAVDTAAVWAVTGRIWTPLEYLSPYFLDRATVLDGPIALPLVLAAWALPFMWIGVSLSLRRAVDAGLSPWTALLFLVPLLNYALIAVLCVLPGRGRSSFRDHDPQPSAEHRVRSALLGVGLGVVVVLGMTLRTDLAFAGYGIALFLGTPFLVGALAGFVYNREHPRSARDTAGVVSVALLMGGGAVLLLALEGALCLAMALPIAWPTALLGGVLGRTIALRIGSRLRPAGAACLALPLLVLPSPGLRPVALREVITTVDVAAPPEVVWERVVAFSEIRDVPELPFRLGIAYPVRARIAGEGVGAVRRCEFSTGPFVEPITAWEPPRRLAFDVAEQPQPLQEWSPYRAIHPPHLDGYFRSRRGEFRLSPLPDGGTRLEGHTFYELELFPQLYWHRWADALVHRIHRRVLRHVKAEAERDVASVP